MTTAKHTPHAFGAPLTAAQLNGPLGQLDEAILDVEAALAQTALPLTVTDATAASGQKIVPVAATAGFVVGQPVWIGDVAGVFEIGVIATIQAGVSLTMVANLANTYAAGKVVSGSPAELVDARDIYPTLDARLAAIAAAVDAAVTDITAITAAMPAGLLEYAQVTADQTGITAVVDLAGLSVTATIPANRIIRVRGEVFMQNSVADARMGMEIFEGATQLQATRAFVNIIDLPVKLVASIILIAPSAAAHTYKLRGQRTGGTGTATMVATSTFPAHISIEDLGSAL